MKKYLAILTLFLITAGTFMSCGKYEEGPAFSLLTKKSRLSGTWEISEVRQNGTLIEELNTSELIVEITFEKDNTGKYEFFAMFFTNRIKFFDAEFAWEFTSDKEDLKITIDESTINIIQIGEDQFEFETDEFVDFFNMEAKILRLTKDELWLEEVMEEAEVETIIGIKLKKLE